MISLVVVGLLALQVLLFFCYVVLVERAGPTMARGVLGAGLLTAMLMSGLWLITSPLLLPSVSGD